MARRGRFLQEAPPAAEGGTNLGTLPPFGRRLLTWRDPKTTAAPSRKAAEKPHTHALMHTHACARTRARTQ